LRFCLFTLFPGVFEGFLQEGLLGKAIADQVIQVERIDFRTWGLGKHRKVDDTPFGGGAGMLLRIEPIHQAIQAAEAQWGPMHKVMLSPQGAPFTQAKADALAKLDRPLGLLCGRYEGFDERIRSLVDEEISLGDFVTLGGEVGAMAVLEAVSRLLPAVIGNQESLNDESFRQGLLEYPQYTKPVEYNGMQVPEVLLSGHHLEINRWRSQEAARRTQNRRPDLWKKQQTRQN